MVVGDSVSGLLDFEFCAYDWRAMELAVALSKCVSNVPVDTGTRGCQLLMLAGVFALPLGAAVQSVADTKQVPARTGHSSHTSMHNNHLC